MVAEVETRPRYAEFFCGGGMVRAALNQSWNCILANDIDSMKAEYYRRNWGERSLLHCDVRDIPNHFLMQPIDLYWASSPCQDFSLAGKGAGLNGSQGSVFDAWMEKVTPAIRSGYAPRLIAFENVVGLVSCSGGADFEHVVRSLMKLGYRVGALEIDARHFLPQSRPRLFVVCLRRDIAPGTMALRQAEGSFHTRRLVDFVRRSPNDIKENWIWWNHREPNLSELKLDHFIDTSDDSGWYETPKVNELLAIMSERSLEKISDASKYGRPLIGTLYKRGRPNGNGDIVQKAEVRFDGLAGCLRTPRGGSSRQTVLLVTGDEVRARLMSSREALRLMGLDESYIAPENYNAAYKIAGDGVAVPVVQYLGDVLFRHFIHQSQSEVAA